jgi:CTP:molybdopterin cytidylyltransferase MocA
MGSPKGYLRYAGRTLLEHVVESGLHGGVEHVVVVTGAGAGADDPTLVTSERAAQLLAKHGGAVSFVVGAPDGAPLDSVQRGLGELPDGPFLLWPVDHPFADAALVSALARALPSPDHIVVPLAGERRGHPVLFGARVRKELSQPGLASGARSVVRRDLKRVVEVTAVDLRVAEDVDTPEDARRLGLVR